MVKDTLLSSQVDTGASCEIVWTCIHNKTAQTLIIGSFYCPPQSPASVLEELTKSIEYIKAEYPLSKVILAGDFNSPGIDWRNGISINEIVLMLTEKASWFETSFWLITWLRVAVIVLVPSCIIFTRALRAGSSNGVLDGSLDGDVTPCILH